MKLTKKTGTLLMAVLMLMGYVTYGQTATENSKSETTSKQTNMKTYLIERHIPNAGQLTNAQLQEIAIKSCDVVKSMGSQIEWDHSYVVGEKLYCVYRATSEEVVREHGKKGEFPVDEVYQVAAVFSPESAKGVIQNTR
ncbi:MAG TPA: DUF4242 domain-containing protein [Bacteroidia bacterium]|nr:DUF4242 domain-containing protein [Bacteroidia bacterium]